MTWIMYQIVIALYGWLIHIVSWFNPKARKWVIGRRGLWQRIEQDFQNNRQKVIWMHCASLGEFEQGRPVLEQLRKKYPDRKLVLTFFSPSGYEPRKNYPGADAVYYLPLDTRNNVKRFIKALSPELVVFVKYEFWLNYLFELHRQQIPVVLISAIFRPSQIFFKPYGSIFMKALRSYRYLFVQDEESKHLLDMYGLRNVIISGDTRFDRVIEIASQQKTIPYIKQFIYDSFCVVAGSTWPADEKLLWQAAAALPDVKWILVPHEIHETHIEALIQQWPKAVRYSQLDDSMDLSIYQTLIIDGVGMLSALYRYAQVAYVGGGHNKGIHNTLEAAVYGIPVLFGPRYEKFKEACDLIRVKGAFCVMEALDLKEMLTRFNTDEKFLKQGGEASMNYVMSRKGATENIMNNLEVLLIKN